MCVLCVCCGFLMELVVVVSFGYLLFVVLVLYCGSRNFCLPRACFCVLVFFGGCVIFWRFLRGAQSVFASKFVCCVGFTWMVCYFGVSWVVDIVWLLCGGFWRFLVFIIFVSRQVVLFGVM